MLTGIGVVLLILDRIIGFGRRDAKTEAAISKTEAAITDLKGDLHTLDNRVTGFVQSLTTNAELGIRLSIRTEAHEERLKVIESLRDNFVSHASKDDAEHASMKESIERLSRVNEQLSAQLSRIVPADAFVEVATGAGRTRAR